MKEKFLKMRVHEHLFWRYKVVCTQNKLSMAKQGAELIRKFVEIQEENNKRMGK